jgi:hypothetical protein
MNQTMKRLILAALAIVFAVSFGDRAHAQASVSNYCWNPAGSQATNNLWVPCSANGYGMGVLSSASIYNTIAASQTNQVLSATSGGSTGTKGDYLSHCIIQPTTTAAGTVTIYDNSTAIYVFTTGTLASLASIAVPIGAVSVSGAWKVTSGANETVTCVGKFS